MNYDFDFLTLLVVLIVFEMDFGMLKGFEGIEELEIARGLEGLLLGFPLLLHLDINMLISFQYKILKDPSENRDQYQIIYWILKYEINKYYKTNKVN